MASGGAPGQGGFPGPGAFGGSGAPFSGNFHGDGQSSQGSHGWGAQPQVHGQQVGQGGGPHMGGGQMQFAQGWNNFGPQQGVPFNNNSGFGGPPPRGNGAFVPQNAATGGFQHQSNGGFQDGGQQGYGRGGGQPKFGNMRFNPGYDGPGYGPGRGWQKKHGKSRGYRGWKNPAGRTQPLNVGGRQGRGDMKAMGQESPNATNPKVTPIAIAQQYDAPIPIVQNVPPLPKQKGPNVLKQAASFGGSKAFELGQSSNTSAMQLDGMEVITDSVQVSGEISKGKEKEKWCFRCCTKGHVKEECVSELFCKICESEEHVAPKCPMKKRPQPMAYAVGYAVDDLGFYHIPHGPIQISKQDSNMALIKVVGDQLTAEELIGHLKRLVPGNFEWDVQLHAQDTWVASFPSKAELKRTINFGSADLKVGKVLKFDWYEEEEYFGHEIPSIWTRVTNLPCKLRTYEVLWALGTMFGPTQRVDMMTTRKNTFGRFKVAVLNPTIVPLRWML